jgi:hypothetical protein
MLHSVPVVIVDVDVIAADRERIPIQLSARIAGKALTQNIVGRLIRTLLTASLLRKGVEAYKTSYCTNKIQYPTYSEAYR